MNRRKSDLLALMNTVVLPQRRELVRYRAVTRQSAIVDSDGLLAELIAAITIGTEGTRRHGKARATGDLVDGTEVKKAYRIDPHVDYTLRVQADGQHLRVLELPSEIEDDLLRKSVNVYPCSLQVLEQHDGRWVGAELATTTSKDAIERVAGYWRVRVAHADPGFLDAVSRGPRLVALKQEKGHFNFGNRTKAQLRAILDGKPVCVNYAHDRRGRFTLAVVRLDMDKDAIERYLDLIRFDGAASKKQAQPYLFTENERMSLAPAPHSLKHLGGRLLALGSETRSGFEWLHWAPDDPPPLARADITELLTGQARPAQCPSMLTEPLTTSLSDVPARREAAEDFFRKCVVGYRRNLQPFCEHYGVTQNIAFGNLAQHLVSLVVGLPGTRSNARGGDLIEADGSPSEIKLATGLRGDALGSEDFPRLNLQSDSEKMLGWRRLFPVRLTEAAGDGIRLAVLAPTADVMRRFRQQVTAYFVRHPTSTNIQYHAKAFDQNWFGTEERNLEFVRVAEFHERSRASWQPVPVV